VQLHSRFGVKFGRLTRPASHKQTPEGRPLAAQVTLLIFA